MELEDGHRRRDGPRPHYKLRGRPPEFKHKPHSKHFHDLNLGDGLGMRNPKHDEWYSEIDGDICGLLYSAFFFFHMLMLPAAHDMGSHSGDCTLVSNHQNYAQSWRHFNNSLDVLDAEDLLKPKHGKRRSTADAVVMKSSLKIPFRAHLKFSTRNAMDIVFQSGIEARLQIVVNLALLEHLHHIVRIGYVRIIGVVTVFLRGQLHLVAAYVRRNQGVKKNATPWQTTLPDGAQPQQHRGCHHARDLPQHLYAAHLERTHPHHLRNAVGAAESSGFASTASSSSSHQRWRRVYDAAREGPPGLNITAAVYASFAIRNYGAPLH